MYPFKWRNTFLRWFPGLVIAYTMCTYMFTWIFVFNTLNFYERCLEAITLNNDICVFYSQGKQDFLWFRPGMIFWKNVFYGSVRQLRHKQSLNRLTRVVKTLRSFFQTSLSLSSFLHSLLLNTLYLYRLIF